MAKVTITTSLKEEVFKRFKNESERVFLLMRSLEKEPRKGKQLSHISGIDIKEIRYGKYRFYFITDGNVLKFGTEDELAALLIKFVRMSEKKDQKAKIAQIKRILRSMGFEEF